MFLLSLSRHSVSGCFLLLFLIISFPSLVLRTLNLCQGICWGGAPISGLDLLPGWEREVGTLGIDPGPSGQEMAAKWQGWQSRNFVTNGWFSDRQRWFLPYSESVEEIMYARKEDRMGKSANGGEGLGDGAWGRLVALLAGSARWTWLWAFRAGFLGLKVWICVAWFWGTLSWKSQSLLSSRRRSVCRGRHRLVAVSWLVSFFRGRVAAPSCLSRLELTVTWCLWWLSHDVNDCYAHHFTLDQSITHADLSKWSF